MIYAQNKSIVNVSSSVFRHLPVCIFCKLCNLIPAMLTNIACFENTGENVILKYL